MSLRNLGLWSLLCLFSFPQVEAAARTGQPSMAKKLKVGAASKDLGQQFILLSILWESCETYVDHHGD